MRPPFFFCTHNNATLRNMMCSQQFFAILCNSDNSETRLYDSLSSPQILFCCTKTGYNSVRNVCSVFWKNTISLYDGLCNGREKLCSFLKNNRQNLFLWQYYCEYEAQNNKISKFSLTITLPYNRTHLDSTADQT